MRVFSNFSRFRSAALAFAIRIVMHHRYFNPAQIVARFGVISATMIWSGIVLVRTDALASTALGPMLVHYIPENYFAVLLLLIASIALYRLLRESVPHTVWAVGYAFMLLYWLLLWAYVLVVQRVSRPAVFASLSVVVGLALVAFIATPKKYNDADN